MHASKGAIELMTQPKIGPIRQIATMFTSPINPPHNFFKAKPFVYMTSTK
jgi:hypothetical protein